MYFILGFILYLAQSYVCFNYANKSLPNLAYWWPVFGAIFGAVTGSIWFRVVWTSSSPEQLYIRGIWWDTAIFAAYMVAPVMLYGVRLTSAQWIGCSLILLGLGIAK